MKNLENFNRNAENVKSGNGGGSDSKMFNNRSDNVYRKQMLSNLKNIVTIDRADTKHSQRKEPDQLSTSSTATNTNFTGE